MSLSDQLDALLDATAFDSTGTKIGAVRQVYVDDATGKITFATVATGIFSSDAIVPLHGARLLDGELHVDHTRSVVRESPRPDHTEDGLTPDQELRLLEHYGIEPAARGRDSVGTAPSAASTSRADATTSTSRAGTSETEKPTPEPEARGLEAATGTHPTGSAAPKVAKPGSAGTVPAADSGKSTTTGSPTPDPHSSPDGSEKNS